jgi:hypothetical protein
MSIMNGKEYLEYVRNKAITAKFAALKLVHNVEILLQSAEKNRNDVKKLKEELEKLDKKFKEDYTDSEHYPGDTIERAHKHLDNLLKPPEKKTGQQGGVVHAKTWAALAEERKALVQQIAKLKDASPGEALAFARTLAALEHQATTDPGGAVTGFRALQKDVTAAVQQAEKEKEEKERYEKRLAALGDDITTLESGLSSKSYGDPMPPDMGKAATAYTQAKAEADAAAKGGNYAAANEALDKVEKALKEFQTAFEAASQGLDKESVLGVAELFGTDDEKAAAKTEYYKRLKRLRPRVTAIDAAIAGKKYGDPPPDAVAKAVAAFEKARAAVKAAQDGQQFVTAMQLLEDLEKAVAAVEAARLQVLDAKIKGALSANLVKDLVNELQPNEILALGAEKQVELLKTLREKTPFVCSKCKKPWVPLELNCRRTTGCTGARTRQEITEDGTPELHKAREKLYQNLEIQPEFARRDKEQRQQVLNAFGSGEGKQKYDEAKLNWGTWDKAKRLAFLQYAAEKQSTAMGHDEPPLVQWDNKKKPRQCEADVYKCTTTTFKCNKDGCDKKGQTWLGDETKNRYYDDECSKCTTSGSVEGHCARGYLSVWATSRGANCPECARPSKKNVADCLADWPNPGEQGTCTVCGGQNTGTRVGFGGCQNQVVTGTMTGGKLRSIIALNPHDNVIGDFDETFNTIMHENCHSFQDFLVKKYRDNDMAGLERLLGITPQTPPEVKKQLMDQVKLFDENNYGYLPDGPVYDKQPVEEHAWKFGNKMASSAKSQALGLVKQPRRPGDVPDQKMTERNL